MKIVKLSDMTNGWFIGNFEPTLYKTSDVEVAVKTYKSGDTEEAHFHKVATEISVVVSGIVEMYDMCIEVGNIIVLEPGEITAFRSITDSIIVAVKIPGAINDKYLVVGGI